MSTSKTSHLLHVATVTTKNTLNKNSGNDESTTSPVKLGSIQFECASLQHSKSLLLKLLNDENRKTTFIGYINPHVFNLAHHNSDVRKFTERCRLCLIDGIGVQLATYLLARKKSSRIVADELFNTLALDASFKCDAVLIGVSNNEQSAARNVINQTSPSINIVDGIDGFQTDSHYLHWLHKHKNSDVILIGAGTPRSEQIALLAEQVCERAVIWHIGAGTIKTWAGTKRRAPIWVSRLGIQWLHRIIFEPHTRSRYSSGAVCFLKNLSSGTRSDTQGKSS